jgi:hypothetical protein
LGKPPPRLESQQNRWVQKRELLKIGTTLVGSVSILISKNVGPLHVM